MLTLAGNAIDVWYTLAPAELAPDRADQYLRILTLEERARHDRFAHEKDRRQYLLGKVLVRTVLSRYFPMEPRAWRFTANNHGKPILAGDFAPHFNLSHTEGLVACALSSDFEVGIDVENLGRSANMDVAQRFFAAAEVAHLEKLPAERQPEAFFLFWTLKESYVKARGLGLSLPLEQFAFCLDDLAAPTVVFEPVLGDDPAQWRFFLPNVPSSAHQVALAVRCGSERAIKVSVRELPL